VVPAIKSLGTNDMGDGTKLVKETFTREQIEAMDPDKLQSLLSRAVKMEGVGVVRKADGTIRYDKDAKPGDYGETPEELQAAGVT